MFLRPTLVIHGGAGNPSQRAAELQRAGAQAALGAGFELLAAGGSAVDAVCAAVTVLENDPCFNAGYGSCLTADGTVEMDASLMNGDLRAGAVAIVRRCRNPVQLARAVMNDGQHLFFAGDAADQLAVRYGLAHCEPEELVSDEERARWRSRQAGAPGTVGAVAIDRDGHLAAATSTGGISGKQPGRIGDSAVIGAGTYADDQAGAASATGEGEAIIRIVMAKHVVDRLRAGGDPQPIASEAIELLQRRGGGRGGIIVVDAFGRVGAACNTAHMTWGWRRSEGGELNV